MKKTKFSTRIIAMFLAALMVIPMLSFFNVKAEAAAQNSETDTHVPINQSGGTSYTIFASGCTGRGVYYNSSQNYNENSKNNGGYDLYSRYSSSSMRNITLGRSFTINCDINEVAELAIYAYDIDESSGEKDRIYLVDETNGSSTALGLLSGMDESWNNTTFRIDPSKLIKGHTYHFELTHEVSGWVSWVRNVTLSVNGTGTGSVQSGIASASAISSISSSGKVTVNVTTKGYTAGTYSLEIKATAVATEAQHAQYFGSISVGTSETTKNYSMNLESGAPSGTYRIDVYLKNSSNGSVAKTATTVASYDKYNYGYYAVAYNSNGGSNNLPIDTKSYSTGNTVTVKFDYLPSREGYVFLGWSKSSNATSPEFKSSGKKTFTMGSSDVVLYAVWQSEKAPSIDHKHSFIHVTAKATCTTAGYERDACACGGITNAVYYPALGHDFESEVIKKATCTEAGHIKYTCTHEGCGYSYITLINPEHTYNITVVKPTCTEDGCTTYICDKCGDIVKTVIPAAHNYISEVIKKSTESEEGIIKYTCTACAHSYEETIPPSIANILVIQDRIPWDINVIPELLNQMVSDGYIGGWTMTTTAEANSLNFDLFNAILIANDQTTSTYNNLKTLNDKLIAFAKNGGTVIYGACDHGWADGDISYKILGDIKKTDFYSMHNYIADPTHPIVTGSLTDDKWISNDLLVGTYCSHSGFMANTLPSGSNIILQDAQGNATLVEFPMENGRVILSGLTWEFYYARIYEGTTSYSMNVFDDLIAYAVSKDNGCNHKYDSGSAVDATCTTAGYMLYTCTLCGSEYKDSHVSELGHNMSEWIIDIEPDCTNPGSKHQECGRCGENITSVIPPLGHTASEWIIDKDSTEFEVGEQHKICTVCSETIAISEVPCKPHRHSYSNRFVVEPTCTEQGWTEYRCTCGEAFIDSSSYTQPIAPYIGHNEIHHDGKAPTCTEPGWAAYVTCSRCSYTTYEELPANGSHDEIHHDGKTPTCTETGWSPYVTCSRCDYTTYEELPANGSHDEIHHDGKTPTCTETGWSPYVTCSRCDYTTYEELPVNNNHDEIHHDGKTPTCIGTGWAAYVTCSRCDYTTYEELPVNNNHDEVHHDGKDPTCIGTGWAAYVTCSRCDYTTYEELPATGIHIPGEQKNDAEGHWYVCADCGYEKISFENHAFETVKYSDSKHWNECSCGYKSNEEDHSYSNSGDWKDNIDGSKTKTASCSCGKVISATIDKPTKENAGASCGNLFDESIISGKDLELKVTNNKDNINKEERNNIREKVDEFFGNSNKKIQFIDISIGDRKTNTNVAKTTLVLEIAIEFDTKNNLNMMVWRNHNGVISNFQALNSRPSEAFVDGTSFVDLENGIIYIYSNSFSTYAISYDDADELLIDSNNDSNIFIWIAVGVAAVAAVAAVIVILIIKKKKAPAKAAASAQPAKPEKDKNSEDK